MKQIAYVLAWLGVLTSSAVASEDYDPQSAAWNGMASFVGLAEGMGFEVSTASSLEWSDLTANDILIVVYPLQSFSPSSLKAFIHAGGHAVVADDFGEGHGAFQTLGLVRAPPGPVQAARYQGNRTWAPVATVRGDHPIAHEVDEVVTNHPAVLTETAGATSVIGFTRGHLVVAGELGTGRYVAISDPSIFINRMLQSFAGNIQLATNTLRWLDRGGRARRIVLVRGDVPMYGEPRPFIDDANASDLTRAIQGVNYWLGERKSWLLTSGAMKVLAATLAVLLIGLALLALPVRRGPKIDGAWLRFGRPPRRDEPSAVITQADAGEGSCMILACILRDHVQIVLAGELGRLEPLYTIPPDQLVTELGRARGPAAAQALARVHRRLHALPSRGQAAAQWSDAFLPRRDFDQLHRDVAELYRTLGREMPGNPVSVAAAPSSGQTLPPPRASS